MNQFKYLAAGFILLIFNSLVAQTENRGIFTGSFESTSQRYYNDNQVVIVLPQDRFASNNYLSLNYGYGKFSVGLQYEAYMPPLAGFSPNYDGSGISQKYLSYSSDFIDFTVGDFYEQFGSGLIFRSYESRALGINNSLEGFNIKLKPADYFTLKMIYGKQRKYFERSNGIIRGLDGEFDLIDFLDSDKNYGLKIGASIVNHYELYTGADPQISPATNAYAARFDFNASKFSISTEYVYKQSDPHDLNYFWLNSGNALLTHFGFAQKGLAMNISLRRLENMDTRSERSATDNELMINYLPANTKQHKYSLANIYPYTTQSLGEIGGQYDLFYTLKKGSFLGGKYGTKLNFNFSIYQSLDTTQLSGSEGFESKFFAWGKDLYYRDFNFEIDKKWNTQVKTILGYINLAYNKGKIEGGSSPIINSNIVFVDTEVKLNKNRSARFELQHLSTKKDMKNWLAALVELNFAPSWSFYASDMYNYGNDDKKIHYYNIGASFVKNTHRIELGYARQRESLLCVGGVCRQVPAFKGFTLNITSTF